MSIDVTLTEKTYTFTVTAPEGEHFLVTHGSEDTIAATNIEVQILTDAASTLRNVGTYFKASGYAVRDNGTITRTSRGTQGSNLGRLPALVRLAVQEGIRESIGRIYDPKDQLNGITRHT